MKVLTFYSAMISNEGPMCLMVKIENCNSITPCDCTYNIYVINVGCNQLVNMHTVFKCPVNTQVMFAGSMSVAEEILTHDSQVCIQLLSCLSLKTYVYACKIILLLAVLQERKRKGRKGEKMLDQREHKKDQSCHVMDYICQRYYMFLCPQFSCIQ